MSVRVATFSFINKVLGLIRLKPLTLGEKCRLQFGVAILVVLLIALLIPYFWISKLTEKISLDSGRAVANTVYERHFQINLPPEKELTPLQENGAKRLPENSAVKWIRLDTAEKLADKKLSPYQKEIKDQLVNSEENSDFAWLERKKGLATNNYIQIVRAKESCMICHRAEGSTNEAFNPNQPIGAIIVQTPAREIGKTLFINRTMVTVAYLLAATGAMISFYAIAQRIILSPIRQLRALVSNVAEGNLDARSSIKSNDEYQKLSDAFNEMLDGLQLSQQKLRDANSQLDGKIAQLSDRNIELFKANQLKSEFLANMSHEFKTPLNSILGFAQLLKEKHGDNPEKSKRYAENIIASGRSLLNMITDLLDLAKAEAGKMELKIERTSIQDLCQGLVAFFSPMTEESMIKVKLTVAEDIPIVQTDTGKVQQILYNILSNAIKFTPENGKVEINAKMLDDVTVRISVTDSGPGIAEENQAHIFEKFRQLDGSITRNTSGTGLGLAISKELSDLLAGTLSVESKLEKGATFHLDIPVNLPESSKEA
jgi:two-component system sensor histidine kinase BarA